MIIISNIHVATWFSGCEIYLIPIVDGELDIENKFLGDDWEIVNGEIYGYGDGPFAIGVREELFNSVMCPELAKSKSKNISRMFSKEEVEQLIMASHVARGHMKDFFNEVPEWVENNVK